MKIIIIIICTPFYLPMSWWINMCTIIIGNRRFNITREASSSRNGDSLVYLIDRSVKCFYFHRKQVTTIKLSRVQITAFHFRKIMTKLVALKTVSAFKRKQLSSFLMTRDLKHNSPGPVVSHKVEIGHLVFIKIENGHIRTKQPSFRTGQWEDRGQTGQKITKVIIRLSCRTYFKISIGQHGQHDLNPFSNPDSGQSGCEILLHSSNAD